MTCNAQKAVYMHGNDRGHQQLSLGGCQGSAQIFNCAWARGSLCLLLLSFTGQVLLVLCTQSMHCIVPNLQLYCLVTLLPWPYCVYHIIMKIRIPILAVANSYWKHNIKHRLERYPSHEYLCYLHMKSQIQRLEATLKKPGY